MTQIRLLLSCFLLFVGGVTTAVNAQVNLKVTAVLNFPDTASINQNVPAIVVIENTSGITYQGVLSVGISTDSSFGSTYLLYFGSQPITIFPLDSVWLIPSNGFTFTNPLFKTGNNVVVVWPISTQAITIDSLKTNVYIDGVLGINDGISRSNIQAIPNPAHDFIYLRDLENVIESVRIYSTLGNLVFESAESNNQRNNIDISSFSSGLYIVRITKRDNKETSLKFLKE